MTFDEFCATSPYFRNAYIYEPGIELYVRKALVPGADYDLANMTADEPGKGALTRFLDKYEPHFGFYVELIHNPRLVGYLTRRGYVEFRLPGQYPRGAPSMLKVKRR